jgi:octanoyl-[GcvH]:protein N-octanoyltransferase
VVLGHPAGAPRSAVTDLTVPAALLRTKDAAWTELVHVYVPHGPTVAFTRRDTRSPGIARATAVARDAGFETAVRSPGGRMVAYDAGAVVVDHVGGRDSFALNAEHHARVLGSLDVDARVGEVEGEYCPGEFSINVGGRFKVVGSAQRITPTGALFSTVVQVSMSDRVRTVIVAVSAALGYELATSTIGGLSDVRPDVTPEQVATALAADYRERLSTTDAQLDPDVVRLAAAANQSPVGDDPFDVDAWARARTADVSPA